MFPEDGRLWVYGVGENGVTAFGEHVDRQLVQPVFVLAEQVGDVADREDGCDRRHDQAARLCGAERGCQFHGSSWSILWAG